jgi:hypothetical protein
MSLVVNTNPDGTFTVTCGAESVTVGRPSPQGTIVAGGGGVATTLVRNKKKKPPEPSSWPIIPGGGGVSTTIVAPVDPDEIKNIHVQSLDQILASIEAHHTAAAKENATAPPVLLRFHVPNGKSVDMAPVSKTMRALGARSNLRTEILFRGSSNE